jgi:hypothetical protein
VGRHKAANARSASVARGNLYISFLDAGGVFSVDLAAIVAAFFAVPDYEGITTRMRSRKRDE